MSFWSKRSSGGARQKRPAKLDFSKVAEADAASDRPAAGASTSASASPSARATNSAPKPKDAPKQLDNAEKSADEQTPLLGRKARAQKVAEQRKRIGLKKQKPVNAKPKKPFQLVVGTGSVISVLTLFAILLVWGAGMTMVLIFGDKLSTRLIAQNSEMQDAYEQRLQAYRDEIARVVTEAEQAHVDKDSVVGRVVELTKRQRLLETRQAILNRLADLVGSGGSGATDAAPASPGGGAAPGGNAPPPPPPRPGFPTRTTPPPAPTRGDVDLPSPNRQVEAHPPAAPIRLASTDPAALVRYAQLDAPTIETTMTGETDPETEAQIGRLERAVAQVDVQQGRALNGFARLSDVRIASFRSALSTLGLPPEQLAPPTGRSSTGLATFTVPISEEKTAFGQRINQIKDNIALLQRLRPALTAMPIERPVAQFRVSSPFGYRIHPILHTKRLHAGIDLAGAPGQQVRAAGSGIVLSAGWAGGFGNMVQIDHGNGLVSRYPHMSEILVAQGQPVAVGGVVGLLGTTGLSTGPHVHFETRLRGVPQNPACFLIAGDRLRNVVFQDFVCDSPPFQQKMPEHSEDEDDDS